MQSQTCPHYWPHCPTDSTPATGPADSTPATGPTDSTPATGPTDSIPATGPTAVKSHLLLTATTAMPLLVTLPDEKQHYTNQLAKDTNKMLKDLTAIPPSTNQSDSRQQRMQKDRLTNDFSDSLNQFQRVQRDAAKVERECVERARGTTDSVDPFSGGYDSTAQAQVQVEDMDALVERENQLKKLESDILDVNQIFKDVASMVHEQGEMIDSIEANVESAEVHVESANTQLVKAREYQKKARRKKFMLIICILITLLIVALILYLVLRN
ncbi:putative syntaxin-7 [Apostichopus japonicus]|uniref:Putative syntaxin-7 n=1 Tax=Stichopus japonicus TaxID=307972 RepID=A0A2G8KAL5_STIJA|nr:putative syntaxin-7 [Apostichopus japonicus]